MSTSSSAPRSAIRHVAVHQHTSTSKPDEICVTYSRHTVLCDAQEKRIRAKHSINQLQKQVKQQQLQVSTRVKKQVASVRNLPRVRTPPICEEHLHSS